MSSRSSKFLDPKALQSGAEWVAMLAERQGTPCALVGGYAMQTYGSDRLTGDLDFIAQRWIEGLPQGKPLSYGGSQTSAEGVPTDIILRNDDHAALYAAALDTAALHDTGLLIARPEYLAAMKLQADRGKDQQDLEFLILENKIDLPETRKVIKTFLGAYAREDFDSFVSETLWKRSQGKV